MKTNHLSVWLPGLLAVVVCGILCSGTLAVHGQDTAFTYQGQLTDNGKPASGMYDLRFTIYDSAIGETLLGGPMTNLLTAVNNGRFSVTLDFGSGLFTGDPLWLQIGARTNGAGAFTALEPRQLISATPYAITARVVTGTVGTDQLSGAIQPGNIAAGTISGPMLADGSVHSNALVLGSIHSNHLALDSVHSNHLAAGSIHSNALALGSVTSSALAVGSIHSNHLAVGSVHSNALVLGSIHSNHLALASVHSNHLATGSIHSNALALGSVTASALAVGSIHSNHLAVGSVHSNALVIGSIHSNHLAIGSVHSNQLAAGAVTASKLDPAIGIWTRIGNDVYRFTGNVGIGTAPPQTPLQVAGDNAQLRLHDTVRGNFYNIYTESLANAAASGNLLFVPGPGGVFSFIRKGDGNFFSGSDAQLKTNIQGLGGVLDRVLRLRPVSYQFKSASASARPAVGLLAQEVEPLFPEVVDEHEGVKALAYSALVPVTVGAIQELNQRLSDELKRRDTENAELKRSVEELKTQLKALAPKLNGGER